MFLLTGFSGGSGSKDGMRLEATGLNFNPHIDRQRPAGGEGGGQGGLHRHPPDPSEEAAFPIIHQSLSPNVVGVLGKEVRLACYVTGLGKNRTVSKTYYKAVQRRTYQP